MNTAPEVDRREVELDPVGREQVRDPDLTPHEADQAAALDVEDRTREVVVAGSRAAALEADARRSRWCATRRVADLFEARIADHRRRRCGASIVAGRAVLPQ